MRVTSLVSVVAPRTNKMIMASVFLKEESICYKMVYLEGENLRGTNFFPVG